jgi:hypothetical protein
MAGTLIFEGPAGSRRLTAECAPKDRSGKGGCDSGVTILLTVHYLESKVLVGIVEPCPPTMGRNLSLRLWEAEGMLETVLRYLIWTILSLALWKMCWRSGRRAKCGTGSSGAGRCLPMCTGSSRLRRLGMCADLVFLDVVPTVVRGLLRLDDLGLGAREVVLALWRTCQIWDGVRIRSDG